MWANYIFNIGVLKRIRFATRARCLDGKGLDALHGCRPGYQGKTLDMEQYLRQDLGEASFMDRLELS